MRPITTLFMLMSIDGKISTGNTDNRDFDKDFHGIKGIKEGLQQYYDLEQETDLCSLNTGKVMAKIGVNNKYPFKNIEFMKKEITFTIIDNNHLTEKGIENLTKNLKRLLLITKNKNHPAFQLKNKDNLEIIYQENKIDFKEVFNKFKEQYCIDKITIQSGGNMNSTFLRNGLIDKISIVVAPALIGGKDTPTLIDGKTLLSDNDLKYVKTLKLNKVELLKESFIHIKYDINK